MANNQAFRVKNGLSAGRYLQSAGTETAGSVGYNLAGLVSSGKSADVSQDGTPIGSHISSDGTKLYMIGFDTDTVYQYDMSTANDLSTATYNSVSKLVSGDGATSPKGLTFKPDGTRMYVLDTTVVYEYALSTAWDLSTASFTTGNIYDTTAETGNCRGIQFTSDGLTMYVGDINPTDAIYQYTLSTAWQVNTASYASKSLSTGGDEHSEIEFNSDGTLLYIMEYTGVVKEFNLTTAYDLSTGSASGNTYDFSATIGTTGIRMFHIFDSGTKAMAGGQNDDTLYQFDIVGYTQTLDLSTGHTFSFTPSGATTVSFTNPPASGLATGFAVEVINTGGYAITWPTSVKWHLGTAPTATATKEIYTFITTDGGTTYYGKKAGENVQ